MPSLPQGRQKLCCSRSPSKKLAEQECQPGTQKWTLTTLGRLAAAGRIESSALRRSSHSFSRARAVVDGSCPCLPRHSQRPTTADRSRRPLLFHVYGQPFPAGRPRRRGASIGLGRQQRQERTSLLRLTAVEPGMSESSAQPSHPWRRRNRSRNPGSNDCFLARPPFHAPRHLGSRCRTSTPGMPGR